MGGTVAIVPNQHTGSTAGANRTWILILAITGWVVLTTVAVLLATGTLSIGQPTGGESPSDPATGVTEQLPPRA